MPSPLRLATLILAAVLAAPPATAGIVFVRTFGEQGGEPSQLYHPYDIAVDADGTAYVADTNNHRIQVFDAAGTWQRTIGNGAGQDDGQLYYPEALAIGPAQRLYVADANDRISVFSTLTGAFLRKWGTSGSGDGQFLNPNGIAVSPDGPVFVTDKRNARVQKFTALGKFMKAWGSFGSNLGQFVVPAGIAFANHAVYVTDEQAGYITEFAEGSATLRRYGQVGDHGGLDFADGISVDPGTQRAFVAEAGNQSRVSVWRVGAGVARADRYVDSWSGSAEPGTGFGYPHGVFFRTTDAPDVNHIYVVETNESRIWMFEEAPGNGRATLTPDPVYDDGTLHVKVAFNVVIGVCGARMKAGVITIDTGSGIVHQSVAAEDTRHVRAKTPLTYDVVLDPATQDLVADALLNHRSVDAKLTFAFPGGCGKDDPVPNVVAKFTVEPP